MSDEQVAARIAAAIEQWEGARLQPTYRVVWGERVEELPVIDLTLDAVRLNHESHRIKANLESHAQREVVLNDPHSEEAQDIIAQVLRSSSDNFAALKSNLEQDNQREPGVITRAGVLINANRRAVALRDLHRQHIRVGVLPSDVGIIEHESIEVSLQMAADYREDYTFTNELLFVEDLVNQHGLPYPRVARVLGWAPSESESDLKTGGEEVARHIRMLAHLRDLQDRAKEHGTTVNLVDFDDKKTSLLELDEFLVEQQNQDSPSTSRDNAKYLRLCAMMLSHRDLGYKPLRLMDDEFIPELEEHLSDTSYFGTDATGLLVSPTDPHSSAPEGGDVFDIEESESVPAEALLDNLLRARADNHIELKATDQRHPLSFTARAFGDGLAKALIDTWQQVDQQRREDDDLAAPSKRLREAKNKVNAAIKSLEKFGGHEDLDRGQIQYRAKKLRDAVNELFQTLENAQ